MDGMNQGSVPMSLAHSSPNSEGTAPPMMDIQFVAQVEEKDSQSSKQHIAYHLLSNLLDDEITDDVRLAAQETNASKTDNSEM